MRILLVEDDTLLGEGMVSALKLGGYAVDWALDGKTARAALQTTTYSACLLDLGLPDCDGLSILGSIRQRGGDLPVLILTARDTKAQRILGLDAGADDYLVKPFDIEELYARLRALIRRAGGLTCQILTHAGITLNPASGEVSLHGQRIELSAREYALLLDLMMHKGHIRSREQLQESLYAWDEETASNIIDVHIHHLRKKLGTQCILTVRGMGYQLSEADA